MKVSQATRATLKSFATAVFAAVVAVVAPSVQAGNFTFDWTTIWHTAVAAAVGYIGQKIVSPPPSTVTIDPSKTTVIDKCTKQPLVKPNQIFKL